MSESQRSPDSANPRTKDADVKPNPSALVELLRELEKHHGLYADVAERNSDAVMEHVHGLLAHRCRTAAQYQESLAEKLSRINTPPQERTT